MTEQLSIKLGLDIIYVYGMVNGVEATFTLVESGLWSAIVPKAVDGKYDVVITAYNSLGTSTTYENTIYKLDDLIEPKLDWTREDYYNAEDLNRVEANTQFVADYLESMGYIAELQEVKSNWAMEDFPTIGEINRIEKNIDALRECFYMLPGYRAMKIWPQVPRFSYEDANRYERNLELLYKWAQLTFEGYRYCGTFYSGEEVI
jgi:hypothetical protein